jgi:phage-related baseplate assembly protein/uncharacterized cupin superfamily protein
MADPEFSLDDLVTPLTVDEVKASIYEALGILGVNTTAWKPGGVVRTVIASTSIVIAALSALQAYIARSGFLELSSGDWLTLVARHVYDVEREAATFAPGTVTLTNGGGGEYILDAGDLIVRNPTTNRTYRNTDAVTVSPMQQVIVAILATEAGAASTSGAGTITDMTTPLTGVSCTNTAAVVGRDAEKDQALRTRCSEKLGSLSPFGPWDAYAYAVRNTRRADGTSLGITRIRTTKDGYGNVTTYVATGTGEIADDDDLDIADEAVQRLAAPLAITAWTVSANGVGVSISYEVWMYNTSGRTEAQVAAAIAVRLAEFMSAQPIGGNKVGSDPGKVFTSAIRAVIGSTFTEIFDVELSSPASDVELAIDEVPVLIGAIATAVHQVAPPEGFSG